MSSPLLRYLRDCYVEDHRRSAVLDVFGRSVEHRLFAGERERILTGELSRLPVDPDESEPVRRAAQLYLRERELLYGALFVAGATAWSAENGEPGDGPRPGRPATVCAPLLLYPARFVEDDPFALVEPDLADLRINEGLIDAVCGDEEGAALAAALRDLALAGPVDVLEAREMAELIEHAMPHSDARALLRFPELAGEGDVRKVRREAGDRAVVAVPASAVLLVPRSRATRGVATELEQMAEAGELSAPVRVLLGDGAESPRSRSVGHVPAVLSAAQRRIVESGASRSLSLAIGPPGTGKSFTIAALALEHLGAGETVIVASRMDHAVDVVESKIEDDLGIPGCVMRGGRRAARRKLAAYVRELLNGLHTADAPDPREIRRRRRELDELAKRIARLEALAAKRAKQEIAWSRPHAGEEAGLRVSWSAWRARRSRPLAEIVAEIEALRETYLASARTHMRAVHARRVADALRDHRREIQHLDRALRARTSGRQADLFGKADLAVLLATFPIWIVTAADVADILPFEREMFDLAIIDEATQCDVASVLPVLQRARRAVVVGDPHQLRHISFLATETQRTLAEKHGVAEETSVTFDYRNRSLLDLADDRLDTQEAVAFLDEHFRSVPPIIAFSADRFYAGRLRLMTEQPGAPRRPAFVLRKCDGARAADGVNPAELERLVDDVAGLVGGERDLPQGHCHSIGVLSPFRAQVDALAEALGRRLAPDALGRHRLMVGTAHTFQGEERDVMFLSFGLDDAAHPAALRFLERPDVFNVAVTRGRVTQYVYHSIDPAALPADSLLRSYLAHAARHAGGHGDAPSPLPSAPGIHDPFAAEVAAALNARGLRTRMAFPVAGLALDLVAYTDDAACGIDLLGYPGHFEDALPLERHRILARASMPVVPISYVRWRLDPEGCVEGVVGVLGQTGSG